MASIPAVAGFSYFFGLFAALLAGGGGILWIAAAFGLLFALSLFFFKKAKPVVLSLGAVTVSLLALWGAEALWSESAVLDGASCDVVGVVEDVQKDGALFSYTLGSCEVSGEAAPEGLRPFKTELHSWLPLAVNIGEQLKFRGIFSVPSGDYGLNPKGTLASKGIFAVCQMDSKYGYYVTEPKTKPFAWYRHEAVRFFSETLEKLVPLDAAHLTEAMLLGDKRAVEGDINDNYRTSGVSHLLVVSGIHLSIIVAVFTRLLAKRKLGAGLTAALLLLGVLLFAAVTGFGTSVLRAGIMVSVMIIASATGRSGDSLSALGLAVLLICGFNPFAAADVGFILSVFATLGIVLFSDRLFTFICRKPFQGRFCSFILENIAVSAAAMVFVTPISMYIFGSYSLFAVLSTAILTVPSTLIIQLGLVICLFGGLLGPALCPVAAILGLMGRFSLWYTSVIPEWSMLYAGRYSFFAAAGICVIMLLIFLSGKRRVRGIGIVCCAAVLVSAVAANTAASAEVNISAYQTADGYTVTLTHGGERIRIGTKASSAGYDFADDLDLSFGGVTVQNGATPQLIQITANGRTVVLENKKSLHEPFKADILITGEAGGNIGAALTLCRTGFDSAVGHYAAIDTEITVSPHGEIRLSKADQSYY